MKAWPVLGIAIIQTILLLAHWFLYNTLIAFVGYPGETSALALRVALLLLSLSFVSSTLISFRISEGAAALFYRIAAIWLGLLNFLFLAACLCWLVDWAARMAGLHIARAAIGTPLFAVAVLAGAYGLLNARGVRVRHVTVNLPNLPASWRGRVAVLLSDLHLGSINGLRFSQRMVTLTARMRPAIVFIAGDLFDGTKVDAEKVAAPWKALTSPFGTFFVTGNHEEYGGSARFVEVVSRAGMRVLANEMVEADGLQIAGVNYRDSTSPLRMKSILEGLGLSPERPSILLNHVPNRLPIVERAGISLQLSGHTHGGQVFPFTWFTRRAFGEFTYGLRQFGALQVYTSSGAGTWGPPMRVGTHPEIVVLRFE